MEHRIRTSAKKPESAGDYISHAPNSSKSRYLAQKSTVLTWSIESFSGGQNPERHGVSYPFNRRRHGVSNPKHGVSYPFRVFSRRSGVGNDATRRLKHLKTGTEYRTQRTWSIKSFQPNDQTVEWSILSNQREYPIRKRGVSYPKTWSIVSKQRRPALLLQSLRALSYSVIDSYCFIVAAAKPKRRKRIRYSTSTEEGDERQFVRPLLRDSRFS